MSFDRQSGADSTAGSGNLPRFRHAAPRFDDDPAADASHSVNRDDRQPRSDETAEPRSEAAEPRSESRARSLRDGVARAVSLFASPGPHRARLYLLMAAFFVSLLPTVDFSVSLLFERNRPLCWTVGEIGTYTGATLAVSAVGALVVTPAMKRCATDWHIAITAALAGVVTHVYKFFVRDSLMMYLCKFSQISFICHRVIQSETASINQSLVYLTADTPQPLNTIHSIKRKMES